MPTLVSAKPATLKELIQPCHPFLDDRGFSLHDLFPFPEGMGQVNWSILVPGVVKAFHRHHKQWDHWVCLSGNAKVVLVREIDGKPEIQTFFIGEGNPKLGSIPPGVLHGYTPIGNEPCGILYWVTQKYDGTDEERAPWDTFGKEVWEVQFK